MRFNRSTSIVQFMYLYTMVLSVTMDQYKKSLDVMRSTCEPKFPELPREVIDDFRTGKVPADVPRDLKCYVRCIYQMSGTLSKKGDLNLKRYIAQVPTVFPEEFQQKYKDGMSNCVDASNNFKDSCDKIWAQTICGRDTDPSIFFFP